MPRSAADRKFGYKAKGLVRILTAADPDEVLTALLLLGLDPRDPEIGEVFNELVGIAVQTIFGFVGVLNDISEIASSAVEMVNLARAEPVEGESFESRQEYHDRLRSAARTVSSKVLITRGTIEDLRDGFADRMTRAKVSWPTVVWPATPGVFEAP